MTTNVATSHENGDDRLSLIRARLYLLDRWVRGRLITTSGGWMCWTRREAVPCDPSGATVGRHAVTAALTETLHPVGSEDRAADHALVYEAGVVASELLSNAARACRSRIAPRLDVHHGGIRIEVYDRRSRCPGRASVARTRGRRPRTAHRQLALDVVGHNPATGGQVRLVRDAGPQHVHRAPGLHRPPSLTCWRRGAGHRVPRPPPRASRVIMRSRS